MLSFLITTLRRLAVVSLALITLCFGIVFVSNSSPAIAGSITNDATKTNLETPVEDTEYEAAKISRQREQAMRSEQAKERAEQKISNETIGEKLGLDEILSDEGGNSFDSNNTK